MAAQTGPGNHKRWKWFISARTIVALLSFAASVSKVTLLRHGGSTRSICPGVGLIHEEKRSGAILRRPVLDKLLRNLKRGDTLVVYKLDRVAGSLKHLLTIVERMQERGAGFESLTERIDTNTPAGRLMLQMLGAFAEFEREMIRERTLSGMQAAKKRGVRVGRPRSHERQAVAQWRTGRYTLTALAHQYGIHLSSIKRAVYRAQQLEQPALLLE